MSEANITDILIAISGFMVISFAGLFWWILKAAWTLNEKEHDELKLGLKEVAGELRGVSGEVKDMSGKVDHIIRYHDGIPEWKREHNS